MAKKKLFRFNENELAYNIIQEGKESFTTVPKNWHSEFFKNNNPIVLELACGQGEYTVGLAQAHPDKNFIGIDIKGSRLWVGSSYAIQNNLKNVAFLRTTIDFLENFFTENEVSEIWIIHPDPRPKEGQEKRRLVSARYLEKYRKIIKKDALIHLKTDSYPLYKYGLDVLNEYKIKDLEFTDDLYNSPLLNDHYNIKTFYERKFVAEGFKINYYKFRFDE